MKWENKSGYDWIWEREVIKVLQHWQEQLLQQNTDMTFMHLRTKGTPGETTTIYLLVKDECLYCLSSADIELFHRFLRQIWVQTACKSLRGLLTVPAGSIPGISFINLERDILTHTSIYTTVGKWYCWQLKLCTRQMTMREKQPLWKNSNLENA